VRADGDDFTIPNYDCASWLAEGDVILFRAIPLVRTGKHGPIWYRQAWVADIGDFLLVKSLDIYPDPDPADEAEAAAKSAGFDPAVFAPLKEWDLYHLWRNFHEKGIGSREFLRLTPGELRDVGVTDDKLHLFKFAV